MKKYSFFTGTVFFLAFFLLFPKQANAWFSVCNRSNKQVELAFGYWNSVDNRETFADSIGGSWLSEGWWKLKPGQCTQVYPHELWRRNRYYYVYARSTDGRSVWSGNHSFCVASSVFTILNLGGNCYRLDTSPNTNFPNSRIERFQQVDIGGGRVQNFTYNLR